MFKRLGQETYLQILFTGIIILSSLVLLMGLGYLIGLSLWSEAEVQNALSGFANTANEITILKMFQILNQLAIFILPPLVLYAIVRKQSPNFLCLNRFPEIDYLAVLLLFFVASLPIVQHSLELNANMSFPSFLKGVETWMIEKEELAAGLTDKFLNIGSVGGFLLNLLMLAILPALGEELLFRGLLMRWFAKVIKNTHINVLVTSLIFSAIHLQFFGFLPRFLLGMLLGYSYVWTKSLWAPICLHFVNNAMTVIVFFWVQRSGSEVDPEKVGSVEGTGFLLLSMVAVAFIVKWLYAHRKVEPDCLK